MNFYLAPAYEEYRADISDIINEFNNKGIVIVSNRNTLKYFNVGGLQVCFKSFRLPNLVNKIIYKYLRKSKARRSFENALFLLNKNIGTPSPIAYVEYMDAIGLSKSYYVCELLENVFELKAVLADPSFPDRKNVIKHYTRFFYSIHQLGIEFLDNSQGNTLFKKTTDGYNCYLVDLNRMIVDTPLDIDKRMNNFSRLTEDQEILRMIADEYAGLTKKNADELFEKLSAESAIFRKKFRAKKAYKNKWKRFKNKLSGK